ncbi:hypothetical protein EZ449_07945 [Pedobacter frigidisoli]|uniref:Uncharacterized protein n=1 Tax=Pedobacter frigidisoli TaxID=2530455 RepID=A0A4R0P4T8_9SPHI|nr:hypothetical protein [Pedobacter frigidisoli]TCD10809.1 hypothetical protein EZ449_07945 [Pedobacter frigidisoli]
MNIKSPKYLFIVAIALTLFLKVSNVVWYFGNSSVDIENVATNDATEKEEKKIETECLVHSVFLFEDNLYALQSCKKVISPIHFSKPNYFPEVLTPPPSV